MTDHKLSTIINRDSSHPHDSDRPTRLQTKSSSCICSKSEVTNKRRTRTRSNTSLPLEDPAFPPLPSLHLTLVKAKKARGSNPTSSSSINHMTAHVPHPRRCLRSFAI
mmetsp:Transcript_44138/g.73596  ORF Transcript_44138/g.73596 Transcript_44138/m.73596 type:complete len:108 (+) Transcript_44138:570-893(+)